MPTIKDVAREAGVSIATVSYVLNNKPSAISEDTRQLVWEAVHKIGYMPNVTARNLRSNKSRLIGYAWHEVPQNQINPVLDHFTYHLAQAAEAAGYHILTFTYPLSDPLPVYDELIRTGRVDAFVVGSTTLDDERIRFLMDQQFPFVCFGRSNPEWNFRWVDTDGTHGMRQAVDYLVGLGHQRIAMVAWPPASLSGTYRLMGYIEGLEAAGIPVNEAYIVRGEHSEKTGRKAVEQWMKLPHHEMPTAVVTVSDLIAVGVMNAAEQHGFVIGRDLSVIGFDDAPMSQYLRPALTTLKQPIPEIGQAIISMLEDMLTKNEATDDHQLLEPSLVIRASCAPPSR
ncbi:MAG TPA: LacI family DNA-binding transcriptional regulator [Oceanobacillus sp.]|nr:LacI family DNA-binding transcriptional regulator [Oceanobacillus sp.]